MNRMEASWGRAYANYDSWRTAAPPEPKYGWEEFELYVEDYPDCGWNTESEADYELFVEEMERREAEARAEALAERMEDDRQADDEAYWASL